MDTLTISIYAIIVSFIIGVMACHTLIPILHKFKFGQTQRGCGPQSHLKKDGTPTMGGIAILLSFLVTSIIFIVYTDYDNFDGLAVVLITIGYGIIGFIDDFIKIIKKRSMGLTPIQKILGQVIITCLFAIYILNYANIGTEVLVPFTNKHTIDLGVLYIPFLFVVMIGTVNGVNLTDGLDGLATGVTLIVSMFFLIIIWAFGSSILPISGAVIGSLLAFLIFNAYPARVFMGDTGSLALGGYVASVAVLLRMPLFIVIVGFVYLIETLSVMIQVLYFKKTGNRFFKMAPIHHHFELSGLSETKVVTSFYILTAMLCLVGFLACKQFI